MLRVLCGSTELEEYGEVIAVGDRVERLAARFERDGELEGVAWSFDRYAGLTSREQALIRGRVVRIEALFTRLTLEPGRGWVPTPGSSHREPVTSTAATRRIEREVEPIRPSVAGANGPAGWWGRPVVREGDEGFGGWLVGLVEESVVPPEAASV